MEIGEAWKTAQGGNAKFVAFPDGSQGGETEMARRMRIGQLQGALLSVVGLNEIEPSISACLLYTSPSPRDRQKSRMPSSA